MGSTGAGTARGGGGSILTRSGNVRRTRRGQTQVGGNYQVAVSGPGTTGRGTVIYKRSEAAAREEANRLKAAGRRTRVSKRKR